ncbi:MAG: UPF0147 family protein [Desulfurococcus sp.]|jgi:uncharacterized protein (UPF0147 family)|uniref:UPF0147 protein DKAM_0139 n=1 Tax=Desulfurococcus amylolyticus (strain DSM 18924 / JCM 16383 / VKM B-2413 / 1221n) TaxID=490899 RepID=Y139_DESA1|nr:UPF0147 family protein [Desulfurococcus amylolyticus]B8D355.1 RecName: Full=UPF0147 protein DKAM_0139 [Desulfurococcus amylolyticus 1221n]ACL10468.1 Protein of unknown function UPF0147 [Desulfurococcus amylolyticus 1221n]
MELSRVLDNEVKLRNAIYLLMSIVNDTAVPRNIRRAATEALNYLRDERYTPGVRAANAVGVLDQVSQDPNMPLSARTKVWQVIAILETIHD